MKAKKKNLKSIAQIQYYQFRYKGEKSKFQGWGNSSVKVLSILIREARKPEFSPQNSKQKAEHGGTHFSAR